MQTSMIQVASVLVLRIVLAFCLGGVSQPLVKFQER